MKIIDGYPTFNNEVIFGGCSSCSRIMLYDYAYFKKAKSEKEDN